MISGIYAITNNVTDEVYIGLSTDLKSRLSHYKNPSTILGQPLIHNSILTYGYDNHTFSILKSFKGRKSVDHLEFLEKKYIKEFKEKGVKLLNSNDGGGGCKSKTLDQRKIHSIRRKGMDHKRSILQYALDGTFIKEWESVRAISKSLNMDYNLIIRVCKNKKGSIGNFQLRYSPYSHKKILQSDLSNNPIKTWDSISDVLNIHKNYCKKSLVKACNKNRPKYQNYIWEFIVNKEKYENIESYTIHTKEAKKVLQYDINGMFLKCWDSIEDVSNTLKISKTHLYRNLNNYVRKYSTDTKNIFQWRYNTGEIEENIGKQNTKVIVQYDMYGNKVKVWNSTSEIQNTLNMNKKVINSCTRGSTKKTYGFQWVLTDSTKIVDKIDSLVIDKSQEKNKTPKFICQYSLNGDLIKTWPSIRDASQTLNIKRSLILDCITGKLKTTKKLQWVEYQSEEDIKEKISTQKIIQQLTLDGVIVGEYQSLKDAVFFTKFNPSSISSCLHKRIESHKNYQWNYKKV